MNVEILSRLQFAITIMFHYIYPPFSIGLGLFLIIAEGFYIKTKNIEYLNIAKFWTKIFAVTFSIGVATGIVMEFEFGTNWATYSRYVGDVFGSALAAEGIFAFFLESGFLALLLFGWNRIGPKLHYFSTIMVALGAHFSAIWIVIANSWMHTPAGFHVVGEGLSARAEITNFWAMVFNPSSMTRLAHVIVGCWLQGAFLVISISAYYLLKKRHLSFAIKSIKIAIGIATISVLLQYYFGDKSGKIIGKYQPLKLASFEAIFNSQREAPLTLFGLVDLENEKINYQLNIPKLLSYLTTGESHGEIKGLKEFPKKDWPNTVALFQIFRMMIAMWFFMVFLCLIAVYKLYRGTFVSSQIVLKLMVLSVLAPIIANQSGWVAAEMGRYPWIVQDLLRISEGLSKSVTAGQVLSSIIMFFFVYLFLFMMFIYLLTKKIFLGPEHKDEAEPYHQLEEYVEEISHE